MTRDELIDYTEWLTQNPVIREWTLSHPISIEIIEANVDRYLAEREGKNPTPPVFPADRPDPSTVNPYDSKGRLRLNNKH